MGDVSARRLREQVESLATITRIGEVPYQGDVYLVGGALREIALGKSPQDLDLVLSSPEDLTLLQGFLGTRSFLLGKKPVQTHRIVTPRLSVDITFLDSDINDDLERRDFTINAIAYDLRRHLVLDPIGGIDDLNRRVIRQPRRENLREDPLRMLKALRHLAALEGFCLDSTLLAMVTENREMIRSTAPERVKYELDLILVAKGVHRALSAAVETGLLFALIPEFLPLTEMDREKKFELETFGHTIEAFRYLEETKAIYPYSEAEIRKTAYSLLFHDLGKAGTFSFDDVKGRVHFYHHERLSRELASAIMERLRFSAAESRAIAFLIENHMRLFLISDEGATEKATRRLVYKMEEWTPCLVLLTLLDMLGTTKGTENETTLQVRRRAGEVLVALEEWKKEPLPRIISGHDLLALGFSEGPFLGSVLADIRERQIAGEVTSSDEALSYAARALQEAATR